MTICNNKLSITQRYLLTYIGFKTKNKFPFFQSNEFIANVLGQEVRSTKNMVNGLIKDGYLIKTKDKKERRVLSLSDKPFEPLVVNMADVDKKLLKQEIDYWKSEAEDWKQKYTETQSIYEQVNEVAKINEKLKSRINDLEKQLLSKGYTKEGIDKAIATGKEVNITIPNESIDKVEEPLITNVVTEPTEQSDAFIMVSNIMQRLGLPTDKLNGNI